MTEEAQQTPGTSGPESQAQPQSSSFSVPEAYQEKGWAKDLKSIDDLWKMNDNAQSLIGKRPAGIPAEGASDEEWNKFYTALGRPDNPDGYELPEIEGMPDGFDISPFKAKAAGMFHAAGLSKAQSAKLWQAFVKEEVGAATASREANEAQQKELDAQYDELAKKHLGDDVDAKQQVALNLINSTVPEDLRDVFKNEISDNPKMLVAVVTALNAAQAQIDQVKKEYGAEGSLTHDGSSPGGMGVEEIRNKLAKLRTSDAWRNAGHEDHKETVRQVGELSERYQRIRNGR